MSKIDDLLNHVTDAKIREQLRDAITEIRNSSQFGLVFEHHIPETVLLSRARVKKDAFVTRRDGGTDDEWLVEKVEGDVASLRHPRTGVAATAKVCELIVVRPFGDPIYPALTPVGGVANGGNKAWHTVISGENYHALHVLVYLYEGQVDCLYLDPPYNTGAKDWTYNNHFVDKNDSYRHSKWLSMMEKRLRIARRLLKPDGVLVITIDENELHHLGMLLERLFPDARRQTVTICINPSGASGEGLSRVEEYALFSFLGASGPVPNTDDMLTSESTNGEQKVEWESLLRRGNTWYRKKRRNLCYPVIIDRVAHKIVGVGEPFAGSNEKKRPKSIKKNPLAWPVRKDLNLGIWRVDGKKLMALAAKGYAYVASHDDARDTWTIRYLMSGTIRGIESGAIQVTGRGKRGEVLLKTTIAKRTTPKTIWYRGRHTAGGAGGTQLLAAYLGGRDLFPFPKSVYAVRDAIAVAVGDRRDALIVDAFAGSGTTFHATCLLNAEDQGTRRCVLITNNEVDAETAAALREKGIFRGDEEYERHGIFEQVTRPRCEAVVTGRLTDGASVEGDHLDGRPYAQGFDENLELYRLDYLDPDDISLGRQFKAVLPLLWLTAGGKGERPTGNGSGTYVLPPKSPFAVLLDPDQFNAFAKALADREDVTHVWIVSDDEQAFARMRSQLGSKLRVSMLYREYLRNFVINAERDI